MWISKSQTFQKEFLTIAIFVLTIGFAIWFYRNFINPIVKIKIEESTVVIYKITNTSKNKYINDYIHCNGRNIDNLKICDSIEILTETFYKKSGDSSVCVNLK